MIEPVYDWMYGKIVKEVGIKTAASITDTFQRVEIISIGPDAPVGKDKRPIFRPGDKVILLKYEGDNDTPEDLLEQGYSIFSAKKIIAKETE